MEDEEKVNIIKRKLKIHPREKCNFLSHLFFCWQLPVIVEGWKLKSSQENFYTSLQEYESKQLGDKLEQLWQDEENVHKRPCLIRALLKLFGRNFIWYGIVLVPTELSFLLGQTFFLKKLLDFYTPNQTTIDIHQAYTYASVMAAVPLFRVLVYHWTLMELGILGMKIRIACASLIYRKALKSKKSTLDKVTIGHLFNLLSNDVNRFEASLIFMHWLWLAPLNLAVGSCYIYFMFGPTAIAGMSGILIFSVIQILITKRFSNARNEAAKKTDYRIQLMNDIIRSIHAIKINTWEKPFRELVESARNYEMKKISTANCARLTIFIMHFYIGKISLYLSALAVVLSDSLLTSQYLFSLSRMYDLFQINILYLFEYATPSLVEIIISIKRIQEYLLFETQIPTTNTDVTRCSIPKSCKIIQHQHPGISIRSATVKWNQSSSVVLDDVNFDATSKALVGVIGLSGSGKSALVHTILEEVEITRGNVDIRGSISYASQEPWIFSASIKQNILFGKNFDSKKYVDVIKVCGLEHDLCLFAHGDQTLVGERGVMLSGGQRARINLARAVYKDSDIYLFDDPLSAVDEHVAKQIFNECFCEHLKQKCVVFVTHQMQFLQNADKLYVVESGRVTEHTNRMSNNLAKYFTKLKIENSVDDVVQLDKHKLQTEIREDEGFDIVRENVYTSYIKAVGHCSLTCFPLGLLLLTEVICTIIDYFMSFWINIEQKAIELNPYLLKVFSTYHCLYIYAFLLVLLILTSHSAVVLFYQFCSKASKNLHNKMFLKILCGTMTFFNQHSSGRIINRFTRDMEIIDQIIPYNILLQVMLFFMVGGIVALIIYNNYLMAVFTIMLLVMIVLWRNVFQHANQNIKRAEGITRSVLLSHLSSSIQGISTIRAFGAQRKIAEEFDQHQNFHSTCLYLSRALFGAFGFWIDILCAVYNGLVIFTFFFLNFVPSIGNVGLAISISSFLIELVQFVMKNWSELEGNMVSVERVLEYAKLDPEADNCTNEHLPKNWPNCGNISFQSVSLKYFPEAPFVLKNVSFTINAEEKIGIVGRTGAGKTSLSSVLFRLFHFDGTILIDDVDTKLISLSQLRSKISIIPQESFFFLGTLRKNIDPFNQYCDDEIWKCLEEAGLKDMVSKLEGGLDSLVSESGSNFSVGEKQLLCLIRVMLRNNKIIVLDEATANIDLKTDKLIQATLKMKFSKCTVLTIAHRLNTIIDYDKILVVDDGAVVEFGRPDELLQNPKGFFYKYVNEDGN